MEQEKQKRHKISNTPNRDKKMLARYEALLREAGEKAKFLGKGFFYEQLSEEFNIEPMTVGIRIRKLLKPQPTK